MAEHDGRQTSAFLSVEGEPSAAYRRYSSRCGHRVLLRNPKPRWAEPLGAKRIT